MAPIAATLLCYFPDELTFVMLVRLWQDKGLKNFFSRQFDGLMNAFKSLEEELKHRPVGRKLVYMMPKAMLISDEPRNRSIELCHEMVSHPVQLFPAIPYTITDMGCLDDFIEWPSHAPCCWACFTEWSSGYIH